MNITLKILKKWNVCSCTHYCLINQLDVWVWNISCRLTAQITPLLLAARSQWCWSVALRAYLSLHTISKKLEWLAWVCCTSQVWYHYCQTWCSLATGYCMQWRLQFRQPGDQASTAFLHRLACCCVYDDEFTDSHNHGHVPHGTLATRLVANMWRQACAMACPGWVFRTTKERRKQKAH